MCARARALAHVTARAGARTQLHSACTRILFRARAVRATVTLTTFPHPRPPDPAPPRVPRRCDAVGSEWWRGGERREERHVPSVTSRGVHCNAVQCRRRSSLLRRDLGPCGGVRRVGDVGPRRRTLFDTEWGWGEGVITGLKLIRWNGNRESFGNKYPRMEKRARENDRWTSECAKVNESYSWSMATGIASRPSA